VINKNRTVLCKDTRETMQKNVGNVFFNSAFLQDFASLSPKSQPMVGKKYLSTNTTAVNF
jgi:hypothetical protein